MTLARAIYATVRSPGSRQVDEADVILAKARLERMGDEEAAEFCFSVVARCSDGTHGAATATSAAAAAAAGHPGSHPRPPPPPPLASRGALEAALAACSAAALGRPAAPELVSAAAEGAMALDPAHTRGAGAEGSSSSSSSSGGLTLDGYAKWSAAWPALHTMLRSLFLSVGRRGATPAIPAAIAPVPSSTHPPSSSPPAGPPSPPAPERPWGRLPELTDLGRAPASDILLQPFSAWMLAGCLPPELGKSWRLAFNSQRDGKSFNTMVGKLAGCLAPSIVIVRDDRGNVFGGFAPMPWVKSGAYFGDFSTFIFQLSPAMRVYKATGINENFMWCGVGFKELPCGIGFGGAQSMMGQFALYVDSTLDAGMSRPTATFANEPLTGGEQLFKPSVIEVWQVKPNEEADDPSHQSSKSSGKGSTSVLDKRAQDRQLLSLAGVQVGNSDGLRPEPPIED